MISSPLPPLPLSPFLILMVDVRFVLQSRITLSSAIWFSKLWIKNVRSNSLCERSIDLFGV